TGPKAIEGLSFTALTVDEIVLTDSGDLIVPVLKTGETGLWVLAADMTGKWYSSNHFRKCRLRNYDRQLDWADEVARLAKMKVAERLEAAKQLCAHKTPEIAVLGVEVLFGAYEPDAEKA